MLNGPAQSQSPNESRTEKERLQRAYFFAIADLNRAVQVLDRYTGVMDRGEYNRLKKFANDTGIAAKQAWLELEIVEHGC